MEGVLSYVRTLGLGSFFARAILDTHSIQTSKLVLLLTTAQCQMMAVTKPALSPDQVSVLALADRGITSTLTAKAVRQSIIATAVTAGVPKIASMMDLVSLTALAALVIICTQTIRDVLPYIIATLQTEIVRKFVMIRVPGYQNVDATLAMCYHHTISMSVLLLQIQHQAPRRQY